MSIYSYSSDDYKSTKDKKFGAFCTITSGILGVGQQTIGKILFKKYGQLQPHQFLLLRGVTSWLVTLVMVNKDLVFMMYSGVPQGNKSNIFVRCLLKGVVTNIQLSIVKYLSLIFLAVTKQMTPITTIILSAFFFSTKILVKDILFCFIAIIAVSFIIFGYTESKQLEEGSQTILTVAIIAAMLQPFLESLGQIYQRKMKNIPDQTIACYLNPSQIVLMAFIIIFYGQEEQTKQFIYIFDYYDWILLVLAGIFGSIGQTLNFLGTKHNEPAKVASYSYLEAMYQLLLDLLVFDSEILPIQWFGISMLVFAFFLKNKL